PHRRPGGRDGRAAFARAARGPARGPCADREAARHAPPSPCPRRRPRRAFHSGIRRMSLLTLSEAAARLARKEMSPVELTQACLERIHRLDDRLNAFITVTAERALADARAAAARILKQGPRTPLDGIPIAHKDLFDTAGIATTAHSRLLQDNVPARDATVVARLAQAGAVMLGKLATLEFALAGPSFDLPWPPARNPWNVRHFTSGSSSGTAVAIAAGMILGGTATDTGGSIRAPAAACGTSGIKPTYG